MSMNPELDRIDALVGKYEGALANPRVTPAVREAVGAARQAVEDAKAAETAIDGARRPVFDAAVVQQATDAFATAVEAAQNRAQSMERAAADMRRGVR